MSETTTVPAATIPAPAPQPQQPAEPARAREADLRAELAAERVAHRSTEGRLTAAQQALADAQTSHTTTVQTEVGKVTEKLSKMQQKIVDAELRTHAAQLQLVDPDLLLHPLLDRTKITVDDEGNVKGVQEAFAALQTAKPDWFRPAASTTGVVTPPVRTGAPTPIPPAAGAPTVVDVTKMNKADYEAHKAQMRRTLRAS